jgi:ribosomal protein S27E
MNEVYLLKEDTMHANYTCPNCENTIEVTFSIKDGPAKEIFCMKCGQIMNRVWEAAIHIPEGFGDDLTTTIANKMAHGKRPTGKDKVFY